MAIIYFMKTATPHYYTKEANMEYLLELKKKAITFFFYQ